MTRMSQSTVPLKRLLFALLSRLALSDRLSGYQETAGPYETAVQGRLGLLEIGASDCHVLDSRDAWLELRAGCLRLAFTVCIGRQPIRRTGFFLHRVRPAA